MAAVVRLICSALFVLLYFELFETVGILASPSRNLHIYEDPKEILRKRNSVVLNREDISDNSLPGRTKRSVLPTQTKLNITTKINFLNDSHQQLMVHWVGEGSDVIVCLARNINTKLNQRPSAVYISNNYGDTFENITNQFELGPNKGYATLDKFYTHPKYNLYMVFADVTNQMIYTSTSPGTVTRIKLNFHPSNITFHEEEPLTFLAYDMVDPEKKLWLTKDFGQTWYKVHEYVKAFYWVTGPDSSDPAAGQTTYLALERGEPKGSSTVLLSKSLFQNPRDTSVLIEDVDNFQVRGDFMFVTRKSGRDNLDLYISHKKGEFLRAQFQSEMNRREFYIADITDTQVFVAVSHTQSQANLYVSQAEEGRSLKFALSLERIFCYFPNTTWRDSWLSNVADETFADFHKVEGLDGIYIASQVFSNVSEGKIGPEHLMTMITFDRGGVWQPLAAPLYDEDDNRVNCSIKEGCSLHLSQKFTQLYPLSRSVPILSSRSAPGVIMATGVLGKSLKGHPGVFLSTDAGLSWRQILNDYYFFNFGDHGGVLVAVKYYKAHGETRELLYSTDDGETWQTYEFSKNNLRVYGLMTEPGENTTIFTMFGSFIGAHQWLILKVDLRNAFTYVCTKDDYKFWSPSAVSGPRMPCLMGRKETYERRVPHSNCYNGRDYDRPVKLEVCECELEDFECDFGFVHNIVLHTCIRNKSSSYDPYAVPSSCKPGNFYNQTKGYRKIPGDACEGGNDQLYLPARLPCPYKEKKEFLIVAQRQRIIRVDLEDPKLEILPISQNLQNVIAIEFDMRNNCVYWADIVNDTISRQCLSDGSQGAEILVKTNLDSIEGMALDWVSNTLYFVDGMRTKIEVVRTDIHYEGRMRRTILDSRNLKKPRGIAVHPMEGFIFWTDWAPGDPSLSRANLDGSNVKRLFVKPRVEWPNGITIDHIAERIYWVDAKLDYIASAALDGSKFKEIIANDVRVKHPFAVAVFKDNLYWDDWEQKAIFTADKDHGVEVHAILNQLAGLMDLKVFAHSIQEGNNSCGLTTNVCSHLCVGLPQRKSACLCPDTMVMKNNECMCPENKPAFANGTCPSLLNTCTTEQFSCSNSVCIPRTWMCDGTNDCGDNSDEMNCSHPHCPAKLFSCGDGKCIEPYWRCDFDQDCADGSDEKNCSYGVCAKGQFQCANMRCISERWRCDQENDCKDGSDEKDCATRTPPASCKGGEFRCAKDSVCIPSTWRCDGEKDCADNSDETSCVAVKCESWQFKCKNNRCIFMSWRCDGDNDCGEDDSSDEENCTVTHEPTERPPDMPFLPTNSCNSWMFTCSNHKCVPYWWKCDGVDDCGDKSDEIGCGALVPTLTPSSSTHSPHSFTCKENEFRCYTGDCILESWVCDGTGDCPGEEDEENCKEVVRCGVNEFMCRKDGSCIHMSWVCDGKIDCPDNSDEVACVRNNTTSAPATPSCHSGFFPCDINLCLPMVKLCDGHQDCYDGFDEGRNCNNATTKVFQVQMSVGDHRTNSSSLLLVWWLPMSTNAPLEYLPSICELNSMGKWINSTWTSDFEHWFTGLKAYARYNMTVFVREKDNANKVFPPAQYIAATTAEGVPSPPWNLTVVQLTSSQVQVSWMAPAQPHGIIQEYTVFLSPPIPPLSRKTTSDQQSVVIESTYKPGQIYSYWVRARNGAAESNDSRPQTLLFDESSVIGSIQGLVITSKNDHSVVLSWKPLNKVEGYRVYPRANPPLPRLDSFIVSENNVTVSNLSPGMTYVVEICGFSKSFTGPKSSISFTTDGLPLPEISGLNGTVLKQHGTTVTLNWDAPKYSIKQNWEYGIYYALNIQELFDKPKLLTQNVNVTVSGLEACESYVFAVGLVGPLGSGPLSSHPYSILTEFNPDAPPKNLHATTDPTNETRVLVTWQSSCPEMDTAVNYSVTIEELTHGQSSTVTLLPTTNTTLNYWFNTRHGGRYRLSVRTGRVHSNSSRVVEYTAPIILPPGQVQVLPEKNGSYFVYWKETKLPDALQGKKFQYVVMVSPGRSINMSAIKEYRANNPPIILNNMNSDTIYSIAVVLETEEGFRSLLSEVESVEVQAASWAAVLTTSNLVSVVVPVILVVIVLVAALGFFIFRHRRLQRSFVSFANSHYDTRSGATTFSGGDGLDEEDSPVIRGFSDDEPLVIA